MAFSFDQIFAVDPSNPANVAVNASVLIFAPGDATKAPLTLTTPSGDPLANPVTVNANGFGDAFAHATLDRVAWEGGGFTGFFTSYEGMKTVATDAQAAAEASATSAANSANLVGAPADAAIATAMSGAGTQTNTTLDTAVRDKINLAGSAVQTALSATYAPTNGGNTTNRRGLSLDVPTFDDSFVFSKISSNQDGWIAVKDLTVTGGFGGQVGQGGPISYFKAIGIAAHHSGQGNYDHFWGSLYHDGTREAGMFIGDITARRGGNAYGGHFRVTSQTTAPPFLVGLSLEVVPNIAKGVQSTATLATTIPAATATTSVVLTAPLQLTSGTNLEFTAADASKVVAYVSSTMGAASTTIPVTSFTTSSVINSGGTVTVGVNSTYLGLLVEQNGSETASAAISVTAPGSAAVPYNFGLNFDASAADPSATAVMIGGSWGSGINMNANSITSVGSITGTGTSPNRDVRLADNLVIDNARHIKFKDAAGASKKVIGVTSSDNFRLIAPGVSKQWEFYDSTEGTQVARITSSGRADFFVGGVTTKYTSGATQPAYLTNGQVEVWQDTGSGTSYLVVNVNGVSKKVALT